MAFTTTSRMGLPQWTAGTPDGPTRAEFNAAFSDLDDLSAVDVQDVAVNQGTYTPFRGMWFYATDTGALQRHDGTEYISIPTLPIANIFTANQSVISDTGPQLFVENATATGSTQNRLRRRTATDGSTYAQLTAETTANVGRLLPVKNSTSGISSDLTGMEGRWAFNWGSDTAPADTLIIKGKAGNEIARFTEGGFVGIGQTSPVYQLDVKSASASIPGARFGATGQTWALLVTPRGNNAVRLTVGSDLAGSTSTAHDSTSGQLDITGNVFTFYGDTSLTAGTTYSPTPRLVLDSAGALRNIATDSYFGVGANGATASNLHIFSDAARMVLTSLKPSNASDLVLRATGSGSFVKIQPENSGDEATAGSFFKAADHTLYAAFHDWVVAGGDTNGSFKSNGPVGFKLYRFTDVLSGTGTSHTAHGAPLGSTGQVMFCQMWVTDGSDAVPVVVNRVTATTVETSPGAGYAGRNIEGAIIFADSAGY